MSQGYQQGQTQNPYGQVHNPYEHQQPGYPPAPNAHHQPQAQHGQAQNPYEQPQSWQTPGQYQQPQSAVGPARPNLPGQADGLLRGFGGFLDFVICVAGGVVLAHAMHHRFWWWVLLVIGTIPLCSFVNQVVLARLTGCSVGKFLMATRVMRDSDGGRPTVWNLTVRWFLSALIGWLIVVIDFVFDDDTVPFRVPDDIGGIRIVRRKHLRERLG